MKKRLVISTCAECPHFDHEYYTYAHTCTKLNWIVPSIYAEGAWGYHIPDNCPLEGTETGVDEELEQDLQDIVHGDAGDRS